MFVLAALLSLLPPAPAAFARPFCGGVEVAGPVLVDRMTGATAPVVGCASHVRVECAPEVVARPVRPWLATGDSVGFTLSPAAVGGVASCVIHSDQGAARVTVWIPE